MHIEEKLPTGKGNLPVALCGNKVDLPDRRLGPVSITFHREKGLQYNDISVKAVYSTIRPFLWLARRILNDPALVRVLLRK
jgi:GTP-binding nuclear protein Ran